jgi:hypothetical protein
MGAPGENDHNGPMAKGSLILLLMDDLTLEEINNMTPNQITELKQQKSEELNNMTLNQIKELKEKKTQEQNNMTLGEFREKNQEMHKISAILGMGQGKFGFGKGLGKMMQGDESMRGGSCAKANQGESKPEMSKN